MKSTTDIFKEIDKVITGVIDLLTFFSPEQINTVPFENSWTPGELAQHIIISIGGFIQQLNGPVTKTTRPYDENVKMLKEMFLNFEIKYQSPASAWPEHKDYNKVELLHKLELFKYYFNHYNQETDLTLTCVGFEFPGGIGHLTRTENLYFLIYHTQRHVHQLKNIYKTIKHTKIDQL